MDWYPHYITDYRRDTLHLNTLEHGAYRLLIDAYMEYGSLPNDDAILARLVGLTSQSWATIAPTIRAFFVTRDSRLRHKRCDRELDTQTSKRASAAERKRRNRLKSLQVVTRDGEIVNRSRVTDA